jgi:hypothetical protein
LTFRPAQGSNPGYRPVRCVRLLEATRTQILQRLRHDDIVLDIGGWGDPFERADWVMDIGSYETRGFYQRAGWKEAGPQRPERFSEQTWIQRDICDRQPYPFRDKGIDFVVCAQTLEDVRDPVWVCSEMNRIGKAGYIDVPSRLDEQSWGVDGPFVGHYHHHWVIDVTDSGIDFVFKPHHLHTSPECYFPAGFWDTITREERVQQLWWTGSFSYQERLLFFEGLNDEYFAAFVSRELAKRGFSPRSRSVLRRALERLRFF